MMKILNIVRRVCICESRHSTFNLVKTHLITSTKMFRVLNPEIHKVSYFQEMGNLILSKGPKPYPKKVEA